VNGRGKGVYCVVSEQKGIMLLHMTEADLNFARQAQGQASGLWSVSGLFGLAFRLELASPEYTAQVIQV
jgi:hypothetical protein